MFEKAFFNVQDSLFLCIDIQEKLIPVMIYKQEVLKNANILLKAGQELGIKMLITEQYPKGLGKSCEELLFENIANFNKFDTQKNIPQCVVFEKTSFSLFADSQIAACIDEQKCKNLFIFGVETHICVLQSVLHALELGYNVYLIEDALSSRTAKNHQNALEFMRFKGANVLNVESVLFAFIKDAKNLHFKTISALIK